MNTVTKSGTAAVLLTGALTVGAVASAATAEAHGGGWQPHGQASHETDRCQEQYPKEYYWQYWDMQAQRSGDWWVCVGSKANGGGVDFLDYPDHRPPPPPFPGNCNCGPGYDPYGYGNGNGPGYIPGYDPNLVTVALPGVYVGVS